MKDQDDNYEPKAMASPRGGVRRKPEAKPRADEQERHLRPGTRGESALNDEASDSKVSGKWRGRAGKGHVLIWGALLDEAFIVERAGGGNVVGDRAEVSRGHSSWEKPTGGREARISAEAFCQRRVRSTSYLWTWTCLSESSRPRTSVGPGSRFDETVVPQAWMA